MRALLILTTSIVVTFFGSSCSSVNHFDQRKYTQGQYLDLHLFNDKSDKCAAEESTAIAQVDSCKAKAKIVLEEVKENITMNHSGEIVQSTSGLHEHYPLLATKIDSTIAKRDSSSWMHDTLPEVVDFALSSQAMLGVGTVGGLMTIAAPQSIWFFILPMILAPLFLLLTLIAGAIAMAKIKRGEIDGKFRGAMKLWALGLLINLMLGSIVLMHYTLL